MRALYRVFPFLAGAAADEPGGALFRPSQVGGRLDNPDLFSVLYLSDSPAGAIAEAFGRFPEWTPAILKGSPNLPGSTRAVGRYILSDYARLCDLDDPAELRKWSLRPSQVVSRDYTRTRNWARMIYEKASFAGVSWWSYYDPRWTSVGLWTTVGLRVEEVIELRVENAWFVEAGRTIVRPIRHEQRAGR